MCIARFGTGATGYARGVLRQPSQGVGVRDEEP